MIIHNNAKGFIKKRMKLLQACVISLSNWYNPETKGANLTGKRISLCLAGLTAVKSEEQGVRSNILLTVNCSPLTAHGAYAPANLPKINYGGKK